ncbi:hypothetical protein [Kitasatospora sp. NPDC091276]|uniref:hypothetical protein n=1 Tax=Kitasatospora sp. NPDC091276 TaxID=3155300 RepID=UPI003436E63A
MIAADIPLAVASKTLRHSTLAITINLYGDLLKDSAEEAMHALDEASANQQEVARSHDGGVLRAA